MLYVKEPPDGHRRLPDVPLRPHYRADQQSPPPAENVTLPLPLRNRLADLILAALHDGGARRGLEALAAVCADPRALDPGAPPPGFPAELFDHRADGWRVKSGFRQHAEALGERAARAARALSDRPLSAIDPPLDIVLADAAALFEASLYFEVHEVLEPYWMRSDGADRQSLQGLIQAAVGFQHLANGNVEGARALLHEGAAKLIGQRLLGRDLDAFARALIRCEREIVALGAAAGRDFDWSAAPRFPSEA
ncbi:MAG: DUF309 domain-containing protein [Candidatus Rokuibacteriota bacterium]